jgi:hypothetical protein
MMFQALKVWEDILLNVCITVMCQTQPIISSLSDYLRHHSKQRLSNALTISVEFVDALIVYSEQTQLIENGCLTLFKFSLADRQYYERILMMTLINDCICMI